MNWRQYIRERLSRHTTAIDEDIVEELAMHAESAAMAARAEGDSPDAAMARVRTDVDRWCADSALRPPRSRRPPAIIAATTSTSAFAGLALDVRFGLRVLRRRPGFVTVAVLTMALGVAGVATLCAVGYGVLLRPLPWADADRLVLVTESRANAKRQYPRVTNASYLAWQQNATTIDGIGGYSPSTVTLSTADIPAQRVRSYSATASLFSVLGVHAARGTVFTPEQERPGNDAVVVISNGLWLRNFGGRDDVIGRTIALDGASSTIIGVMPGDFAFPDVDTQVWTPQYVGPVDSGSGGGKSVSLFNAVARLKPGVTPEQAADEATSRSRQAPDLGMVGIAMYGSNGAPSVSVRRLIDAMTADVRAPLGLFLAAVALLFATAVANIAGMQLARATSRRREVAIRSAIGASGGRIARQLLIENAIVGLAGGAAGLLLALWLRRELPSLLPSDFPRLSAVAVDWRVIGVTLGLSILASLAFGLLPTLLTRRVNLVEALVEDSLAPVGGNLRSGVARMRAGIMMGQVAVAAILLVGAALLIRSFVGLANTDRGFNPDNLLTAQVPMGASFTGPARAQLVDRVIDRLQHVPGVTHAAATSIMPLSRFESMTGFTQPARPGIDPAPIKVQASPREVSPDYFAAMGMRLIAGRSFADSDTPYSREAVIVNKTFARMYLAEPIVGSTVHYGAHDNESDGDQTSEVIGVVDDVKQQSATDQARPELFTDYRQSRQGLAATTPSLVVRTAGNPASLVATLRSIVNEQDSSLALDGVMTMADRVSVNLARPRLYAMLLGGLAAFALLIAGVGLFGVLSYTVSQRTREIGVRTALGATPLHVLRLIAAQGIAVVAAGTVVGLIVAYGAARYVGTFLFGVATHDPLSFAIVPVLLLVVGFIACIVPARRAAKIDPLRALRQG